MAAVLATSGAGRPRAQRSPHLQPGGAMAGAAGPRGLRARRSRRARSRSGGRPSASWREEPRMTRRGARLAGHGRQGRRTGRRADTRGREASSARDGASPCGRRRVRSSDSRRPRSSDRCGRRSSRSSVLSPRLPASVGRLTILLIRAEGCRPPGECVARRRTVRAPRHYAALPLDQAATRRRPAEVA